MLYSLSESATTVPEESIIRHILIEVLFEGSTWLIGKLGRGAVWLMTLGRVQVDEESWTAVIVGGLIVVAIIIALTVW